MKTYQPTKGKPTVMLTPPAVVGEIFLYLVNQCKVQFRGARIPIRVHMLLRTSHLTPSPQFLNLENMYKAESIAATVDS